MNQALLRGPRNDKSIVTDETRVGLEKQCWCVTINVDGVKEVGRGKFDEPLWGGE